MAFILANLQKIASGGAIGSGEGSVRSVWHYASNDLLTAIDDSGYFNDATDLLTKGDLIIISGDVDGTPAVNCAVVNSETGAATVTTALFSGLTQTFNARYALTTEVALTDGTTGHVPIPFAGTISSIKSVLTGGAVATNDAVVTGKIGSTAITNGVITVTASGSAIGDVDTCTPTAANAVVAGDFVCFTVSGTPGGSRTAHVTILIDAAP